MNRVFESGLRALVRRLGVGVIVVAAVSLGPGVAHAEPELLGLTIRSRAQVGGDGLALIVRPRVAVKSLRVTLEAEAGARPVTLESGRIRRGQEKRLTWSHPVGHVAWKATVRVRWASGKSEEFALSLETDVYDRLKSTIRKEDVDLKGRSLSLTLNQPAARVALQVWDDDGQVVHTETTELASAAPNEPIEVSWEQPDEAVILKIEAKVWSEFGFWVATEIYPYEVQIPHEDVVFDTGSAQIKPDQAPKLEAAAAQVADKLRKYGKLVDMQLYVAGFTDTVGGAASNRALSEKRARAIGAWFRAHGLKLPMLYQGFGESNPAVETADETPEARNRRAVYTLSAGRPALVSTGWKRL